MRKYLIFLIFLFALPCYGQDLARLSAPMMGAGVAAAAAGGTWTYVQGTGSNDGNSIALTGVGAGNLIVIYVAWANSPDGTTGATVSDGTTGLTMGTLSSLGAADRGGQFGYLLVANSGNKTYTITWPSGINTKTYAIMEFSYTGTASLDAQAAAKTGNGTALSSNAITTTSTSSLVLGGGYNMDSNTFSSELINGGAADGRQQDAYTYGEMWYKILASTFSGGVAAVTAANSYYVASMISFKLE
jgi:hypothetical protein